MLDVTPSGPLSLSSQPHLAMSVRSNGRSLSFEILSGYVPSSGEPSPGEVTPPRKRRRKPRKKKHSTDRNHTLETILNSDDESLSLHAQEIRFNDMESRRSVCASTTTVVNQVHDSPSVSFNFELKQRNVNGGLEDADVIDEVGNRCKTLMLDLRGKLRMLKLDLRDCKKRSLWIGIRL
jgi:hypothetical protein